MPHEPPRPFGGPGDPGELARLAAEGQRRIQAANQQKSELVANEANRHLRYAIGAVRGTRSRWFYALLGLAVLAAVVGFGLTVSSTAPGLGTALLIPGILTAVGAYLLNFFAGTYASRADVEAERQWVAGLPFALEGHFEALSVAPRAFAILDVELTFHAVGLDLPTLQGLAGLIDPDARTSMGQGGPRIRSGQISGFTGVAVNRSPVCRNHRVARYLHDLVDRVLLPLHQNRPLARVRVFRT